VRSNILCVISLYRIFYHQYSSYLLDYRAANVKYRHIWKYGYVDVTALSLFRAQPLGTGSV